MSIGADRLEAPPALPEVFTLSADSPAELLARLERGERDSVPGTGRARLAIVEPDENKLAVARKAVARGEPWRGRRQVFFSAEGLVAAGGKVAFLFPGIDARFDPRAEDLSRYFGVPVPPNCEPFDQAEEPARILDGVLRFNAYMYDLLVRLGVAADAFVGHSIGEWNALHAAGALGGPGPTIADVFTPAALKVWPHEIVALAAGGGVDAVREAMAGLDDVYVSHDNCPHQVIVSGPRGSLETLNERLRARGILGMFLPFTGGYHTPCFDVVQERGRPPADPPLGEPRIPVWSATSAAPFPPSAAERRAIFRSLLVRPVRFRETIEAMYAAGHRVFVQVGTGSLAEFVDDILGARPHAAVSANHPSRTGLSQLVQTCALLWTEGASFDTRLLAGAAAEPTLDASDPVHAAVLRLLAEIDAARDEVLDLLRRSSRMSSAPQLASTRARAKSVPPGIDRRVTRLLDIRTTTPYLIDHSLQPQRPGWPVLADWFPVVPMAMEIEMARRAAEEAFPGFKVVEVRNAHARKWLGVAEPLTVAIALRSREDGVVEAEIEGHFRAELILADAYPPPPADPLPPLERPRAAALDAESLYREGWMFHGPAYQGVTRILARGENGMDAELRVPIGEGGLLDNMGQVAGTWLSEEPEACMGVPIGVDRVRFFAPAPEVGKAFRCRIRVAELDPLTCISRQCLTDATGRVHVLVEGWRSRRYQIDRDFRERTRLAQVGGVARPLDDGVAFIEDRFDTAMVRDFIARRYLAAEEAATYDGLEPRRRRPWLNGRCAAKDAVRHYLHARGEERIFPKEMVISNEASGRPVVRPNITTNVPRGLHISLTHKDHLAAAIASDRPVGIDLERIEARGEAFVDLVLSADERAVLGTEAPEVAVTRAWVAKEAAAKAEGTGLGGNPRAWAIEARSGDDLRVNGRWVTTRRVQEDYIVGWTVPQPTAQAR